jgi:hypothetical protein
MLRFLFVGRRLEKIMMKIYFSIANVSRDAGTFHYLYPVVLVVMVS